MKILDSLVEMVAHVHALARKVERHDRELASQMKRSSTSAALNGSEGIWARAGKRRSRLEDSVNSARETDMALRVASACGYLAPAEAGAARDELDDHRRALDTRLQALAPAGVVLQPKFTDPHGRSGHRVFLENSSLGVLPLGAAPVRATLGPMLLRSGVGFPVLAVLLLSMASALNAGCGDDDDDGCRQGDCVCRQGESCSFGCRAPPCHVDCLGDNADCRGVCANGSCTCGDDSDCTFECASPPCHVDCTGETCTGTCANGDCRCAAGGSCDFSCLAPPCHVACEGDNPICVGACANGTCTCEAGSECAFECLDHNCGVVCEAGSACTLSCAEGEPGTQGCDIDCGAGTVSSCADGSLACGMPCPA